MCLEAHICTSEAEGFKSSFYRICDNTSLSLDKPATDSSVLGSSSHWDSIGTYRHIKRKELEFLRKFVYYLKFYKIGLTLLRPIVIYASETCVLKEAIIQKLLVFEKKILRRIFGPTKENQIWIVKTNEELDKQKKKKI
jgi:hypothetical protein